ncbi:Leucine Rich Repeat family protein [Histomonas meleagridis]|uniref:Leucine Rich Repeat family protein n=1 Tax=Histomonas meleagridis TaxID=135588 RepID=UPI003559FBE7|nr:Leucine Rich Repeat family protein [Histomonas meleagridis]KAH0797418.1 Leucine Rich Repeat family protein [Histomonas meleagridis]
MSLRIPNAKTRVSVPGKGPRKTAADQKLNARKSVSLFRHTVDNPLPTPDPLILDLSGRLNPTQFQLNSTIQVLDLSNNLNIPIDYLWEFELPSLQTLRISHCWIKELPQHKPKFSSSLLLFSLDGNELSTLPNWIYEMPELKELVLFGNKFKEINFPATERVIRLINLGFNPLTTFNADPNFQVQILNLNQTRLKEIKGTNILTLKSLSMSKCQLEGKIEGSIPSGLSSLDLSYNRIDSFSDNFFSTVKAMSLINLSHNCIKSLPNSFPSPHSITRINLSDNLLTEIPPTLLVSRTLEYFNISHNQITVLPEFKFNQIRDFNVSFNHLKELPNSFDNSTFLTTLNASFNELSDLPRSMVYCRRLTDLYLSSNKLKHIPNPTLSFATLRTLIVCDNIITTLPDSLGALFHLKTLDLSNNHIHEFPKIVEHFKELRYLSLSHNRINEITISELSPKLQTLDLSFNNIQTFPDIAIPSLCNLSLQYNKLSALPDIEYFPLLKFFSIGSNELKIDEFICPDMISASIELFGNEITQIDKPKKSHIVEVYTKERFGVGIGSTLGNRQTMEDSYTITYSNDTSIFMVFDGHAGPNASELASERVMSLISLIDHSEDIVASISNVLNEANNYIFENQVMDGTTCAGVIIKDDKCYVTGIGDSRVVRVLKNSIEQITEDHKTSVLSEMERLQNEGFYLSSDGRISRKLAVSRALGDFWCKEGELFVEPEIDYYDISDEDVGVIIACDGLWDVISNEVAGDVMRKAKSAADAAITLKNLAYANGSQDNITVITVMFEPKEGMNAFKYINTVEEVPDYKEEQTEELFFSPPPTNRRRRR